MVFLLLILTCIHPGTSSRRILSISNYVSHTVPAGTLFYFIKTLFTRQLFLIKSDKKVRPLQFAAGKKALLFYNKIL